MIPVAIRAFNRPVMLDVTLKSVLASGIVPTIIDDCSDDPIARAYLDTDDAIDLPEAFKWPDLPAWRAAIGHIAPVRRLRGIASRVHVVRPVRRLGLSAGLFYAVVTMFETHPNSEAIILLEGDTVVGSDWFDELVRVSQMLMHTPGPFGNTLGILSAHNPYPRDGSAAYRMLGCPGLYTRWHVSRDICIGAHAILVTRHCYESVRDECASRQVYKERLVPYDGSPTLIQACVARAKCNVAALSPSRVQHIGFESIGCANKTDPMRAVVRGFQCPGAFAFERRTDDGMAYSEDWL